jgi:glycosyltransferase involved in cell wall biosynthesis
MSEAIKYSLVIPCFNEAANLEILSRGLNTLVANRSNIEVILVDNGSEDETCVLINQICRKLPQIKTVKIDKNQGYGNGISTGFKNANGSVYIWTHADLQCDPLDIERAVMTWESLINSKEYTIVKGKRRGRTYLERVIATSMSIINLLVNKVWISDINGQPNLVQAQAFWSVPAIPLDSTFEMHILTYLKKIGKHKVKYFDVEFSKRINGLGANEMVRDKISYVLRTIKQTVVLRKHL